MRAIWVVLVLAGCGGAAAESPLTVSLGLTHDATAAALKAHQFCHRTGEVDRSTEVYPRCDRPAAELGDAWVSARFEGDRLVELRRWERYGDDSAALERWNQLIAARSKVSTPSDEAVAALKQHGSLEPGTKAVKAFRGADGMVVGVYLLTPAPPENANVLEKITYEK